MPWGPNPFILAADVFRELLREIRRVWMSGSPLYLGVDVGGTNIKFGVVDDDGQSLVESSIPTHQDRGGADAVARMAAEIDDLLQRAEVSREQVRALGLATPGTMNLKTGMLLSPPNLPAWSNFPIRDDLAAATRLPVHFANDATAAGFGEYWVGSGSQYPSMVLLTLGTGIGAGIILDGQTIDGEHSHGSECGHNLIDIAEDARICSCGQPGHLEAYASAKALIRRAKEQLQETESSIHQRLTQGDELTPLLIAEEAEAGDATARVLVMEVAHYLAIGIVSLAHTLDPAAIILGGAMTFGAGQSELGQAFLAAIKSGFTRRTFPVLAEKIIIDFAALGGDAGYIGAAGMARAHFGS